MAPQDTPSQPNVMLSDVMGRDRSMNIFASQVRDVVAVSQRLESTANGNTTVLAPRNSAVDEMPHKPWEDDADYAAAGVNAYEGEDGRKRAQRNLERFVRAHVLPASPWEEGKKCKSLLEEGGEVWWEKRGDKRVIMPDEIEVAGVVGMVGNGEIWIINGVRRYS